MHLKTQIAFYLVLFVLGVIATVTVESYKATETVETVQNKSTAFSPCR